LRAGIVACTDPYQHRFIPVGSGESDRPGANVETRIEQRIEQFDPLIAVLESRFSLTTTCWPTLIPFPSPVGRAVRPAVP
jgi:hypothetical protein